MPTQPRRQVQRTPQRTQQNAAPRKFRITATKQKYAGEDLETPVKVTLRVPVPENVRDFGAYAKLWEEFDQWGDKYDGSDKKNYQGELFWLANRPSLLEVIQAGLRDLGRAEAESVLNQMAREQRGMNGGLRRGRGVREFGFDRDEGEEAETSEQDGME